MLFLWKYEISVWIFVTLFRCDFCNKNEKIIFSFIINAVFGQNRRTGSNQAISKKYRVAIKAIKLLPFLNHATIHKNTINLG